MVVGSALDEIYSALDNVGTVHVARFAIVDNNLLMFSFYDGDFHAYIRDFMLLVVFGIFLCIMDNIQSFNHLKVIYMSRYQGTGRKCNIHLVIHVKQSRLSPCFGYPPHHCRHF